MRRMRRHVIGAHRAFDQFARAAPGLYSVRAVCAFCGAGVLGPALWTRAHFDSDQARLCIQCYDRIQPRTNALHPGMLGGDLTYYILKHGNGCRVCGRDLNATTRRIDHCHACGEFRGALCNGCNVMIGRHADNSVAMRAAVGRADRVARLRNVADYIETHICFSLWMDQAAFIRDAMVDRPPDLRPGMGRIADLSWRGGPTR